MGIDVAAALVVGLPYEEIYEVYEHQIEKGATEGCQTQDFQDWWEENLLSRFSPWYDAESSACLYGYSVACSDDYSASEVEQYDLDTIHDLMEVFYKLFSKKAKVYITPNVS